MKNETIKVRVSDKEKRAIAGAANRDGLMLSAWVRQVTLRAAGALPKALSVGLKGRLD